MIRYLYLVIDLSRRAIDNDIKPSRLNAAMDHAQVDLCSLHSIIEGIIFLWFLLYSSTSKIAL